MKRTILFYLVALFPIFCSAQSLNVSLLGTWDGASVDYNDIWGYVDNQGNEYAIIGSLTKIHVVNVTNPSAPTLVSEFSFGASSIWRDFKTYGNYAYGVADQGSEGLIVLNLSNLPNSVTIAGQYNTDFLRAHNIFIDTQHGRLYVAGSSGGSNPANNGLIVYNLTANPANPVRLASNPLAGGYVHDVYVRNHVAYCSHGSNGLYVYNMSNAANEVLLGSLTSYPEQGYNHSGWLNPAGNWYVFADETHGKKMHLADVSDLTDITVGANNVFRQCLLSPSNNLCIPHNPFINGNLVYISYYHDGLQIWDISNPNNAIQVGYYDTYPSNTNYNGYQGAWGCYPFLPSGNILMADISTGLYVLSYNAALPVELINFRANYAENRVDLRWETMSELNNDHFEVRRSDDGLMFETIARVQGHGNTNDRHDYSVTDHAPLSGKMYYRLVQVDFNGKSNLGKTVAVDVPYPSEWMAYPTVVHAGSTSFRVVAPENVVQQDVDFQLFNIEGRLISENSGRMNGGEQLPLDANALRPGSYALVVNSGAFQKVFRVVVLPD